MAKWVGEALLVLLLLVAGVRGTMRLGWWNPSYGQVKADQAAAPSRFGPSGTVHLHIREEGESPVMLMLHSSITNLREWNAWADALKGRYRVIRFDWPRDGLATDSAPSTGMPGVLSLIERAIAVTGLKPFSSAQVTGRDLGVWLGKVHAK
ncbi:hypothetical protein [Novosphingobium sp.]|uniref:alpha/beta fold hydrolase n=1 Tax=Novosphingobium sp. TaxID=1874826 RepID=UPI00286E296D|nr:hypothetical protein [Novosphingobium sp.]